MAGRILAVGDIHGCHRALVALLRTVVKLVPTDVISVVVYWVDFVDRGPGDLAR